MKRLFSFLSLLAGVFLILPLAVSAQSTLFSTGFENAAGGWIVTGISNPNTWISGTCAGNGIALPGTKSVYISPGGTVPGCGVNGTEQYAYANAPSGSRSVIYSRNVSNSCFSALQLAFDIRIDGVIGQDFAEVIYSTDNGATWMPAAVAMTGTSGWQTMNVALPASLNNTSFRIGFRFTYDDVTVSGSPAAIDNVILQGTTADATNPTAICPATFNIYATASCMATVPDLPPSVTKSDNCTAASDLMVGQSPAIGSTVPGSAVATITVTDQAGNFSTCTTSLVFIDTMKPVLTCPATQTAYVNGSCIHTLTDLTGLAGATDNCTASGSIVFTQTPVSGTGLSPGTQTIALYGEDAAGNVGTCTFSLTVVDTIRPVVTCPASINLTANALCQAHAGDLTAVPLSVSDNCTSNANLFSYSQVPAATATFSGTIQATIYVADEYGNVGQCQLNLIAADTVPPIVTCLSDTTVFTTNPCNYVIPNLSGAYAATDACTPSGLTFSQSPSQGSPSSGLTVVQSMVTDVFGNVGVCYTNVHPVDVVAPTVTCPADLTINNGFNCFYTLPDYSGMVTIADNCPGYSLSQSPPATSVVSSGSNAITMIVTDAGANQTTCTFHVNVIETLPPSIACPPNMTSCDSLVTYTTPAGTDNCLYLITQTDNSGLTSGSVFPEGLTTQTYTITDSSGNAASCSFTIEVLEIPDLAVISIDTIKLCNQFSTAVSADAVSSGTGAWSVIQGTAAFADASASATTASGLGIGTNKLMWSVSSPLCGTRRDTLVVIVWPLPTVAQVQDTMVTCTETGVFIQGSFPVNGIGTWTNASGVVFEDNHAAVTEISNLNGGSHTVAWTISSGICPVSSDTMVIVLPNIAVINFPDTVLCNSIFPITLSGTPAAPEQHEVWNVLTGEAEFSDKYATPTTLIGASLGTVQIVYWLTHQACGNSTDTLTIFVQECTGLVTDIPTLFTPNNDSKNDHFEIPHLAVTYPGCRVEIYNRWGGLVFESDGYMNPWDGTYKGEPVPMGTYFYHVELHDPAETAVDGSISIIR
jgi:gliding motility-associated-like protein